MKDWSFEELLDRAEKERKEREEFPEETLVERNRLPIMESISRLLVHAQVNECPNTQWQLLYHIVKYENSHNGEPCTEEELENLVDMALQLETVSIQELFSAYVIDNGLV